MSDYDWTLRMKKTQVNFQKLNDLRTEPVKIVFQNGYCPLKASSPRRFLAA